MVHAVIRVLNLWMHFLPKRNLIFFLSLLPLFGLKVLHHPATYTIWDILLTLNLTLTLALILRRYGWDVFFENHFISVTQKWIFRNASFWNLTAATNNEVLSLTVKGGKAVFYEWVALLSFVHEIDFLWKVYFLLLGGDLSKGVLVIVLRLLLMALKSVPWLWKISLAIHNWF